MAQEWLWAIGAAALCVYIYCSYMERRGGEGAPISLPRRPDRDWRVEALSGALEDLCDAGDGPETVYVFLDQEKEECRWSENAFRLAGEIELCTIEAGGVTKLAAHLRQYGTLDGMAEEILKAYAKKHGGL